MIDRDDLNERVKRERDENDTAEQGEIKERE